MNKEMFDISTNRSQIRAIFLRGRSMVLVHTAKLPVGPAKLMPSSADFHIRK